MFDEKADVRTMAIQTATTLLSPQLVLILKTFENR